MDKSQDEEVKTVFFNKLKKLRTQNGVSTRTLRKYNINGDNGANSYYVTQTTRAALKSNLPNQS